MEQETPVRNGYLYARKTFSLSKKPTSAALKTSADNKYKLYINGQYVGKGPVRSGYGYTYYDEYDITELLNKGKNVISFLVHHLGEDSRTCLQGAPGLICKAEIDIDDEKQIIVTDESWKVRRAEDWTDSGVRLNDSLGFQEVYDAAQHPGSWTEVKFSEKGWQDAVSVGAPPNLPWGPLTPREIPQLAEEKVLPHAITLAAMSPERSKDTLPADVPDIMAASELTAMDAKSIKSLEALLSNEGITQIKALKSNQGVAIILDFGKEVFGNVEIGIGGSGTGCIDIGYSELLEDGRVKPNRGGVRYTDRILLKKGRLDWQSFEPRAFRYMQIEFRWCSKAVALEYIRVNETTYPVQQTGSFECSDSLLNEIWRVGARTTQLCMEDTFIDCPWRERAQWWGDARIESRVAYYAFDDTALLAQGLRQIARSQNRDGSIPGISPAQQGTLVPDFALSWVFSMLDYYAFSDDAPLLHDLYPNVKRLLQWFAGFTGERGLLADVPGELFIDWADLDKRGEVTALNALYHQALRVAYVIASIVGNQDDAVSYMEQADRLKRAINKYTYSPKQGLYAECIVDGKLVEKFSRQTNILVALSDIPDHYQKASIYRQVMNGAMPELTTPYFASHMLEALYNGELHDDALNFMRRKWGDMIRAGATTFHEFFSSDGSMCHGWSASPTRDLIAEYVGIKPVFGSHRFSIAPHTGGLKWARGSVDTNEGQLWAEWRVVRNSFTITVEVPGSLRVDIYPPAHPDSTISVNGKAWPSRFVSLGGGTHRIRIIAAKPAKPAIIDKNLAPKPTPHVELLDDVVHLSRRYSLSPGGGRGRLRARRRDKAAPVEVQFATDEVIIPTAEELIETQEPEEKAAAVSQEAEQPGKHRRSRRGGRGRSRKHKGTSEGQAVEAAETALSAEAVAVEAEAPVTVGEPVEVIETAAEEHPSKRRRSRRGGRGRSRKKYNGEEQETSVESTVAEMPAPQPAAEAHAISAEVIETTAGQPTAEEPKKRRTRRGGRGRSRSQHEKSGEGQTAEEPVAIPTVIERPSEPVTIPEPTAEPSEAHSEEKPVKKRRTYTRRKPRAKKSESSEEGSAPAEPAE